ncbi:uncharacterized protein LOC144438204 [Glandiceps talaboti]
MADKEVIMYWQASTLYMSCLFFGCLVGLFGLATGSEDIYYMANWDHCIEKIDSTVQGGRVSSQIHDHYSRDIDCIMTIEAEHDQQILVKFEKFDIPDVLWDECKDALYVYEGYDSNPNNSLTTEGGLCGTKIPSDISSNGRALTLRFRTNNAVEGRGYTFVFAAFTVSWVTHTCPREGDFRCENSRCIEPTLLCDGNDNCGDGTDESTSEYEADCPLPWTDVIGNILRLGNAAIIGLLAVLIALVISMICLIACCCRKRRCCTGRSRKKRYMRYSQAVRGEIAGNTLQYQHERRKAKKKDEQSSTLRSYTPAIMEGGFAGDDYFKGNRRRSREIYRPIREDSFPQLPTPSNTPINVDTQQQNRASSSSDLQDPNMISAVMTSLERERRRQGLEETDSLDI